MPGAVAGDGGGGVPVVFTGAGCEGGGGELSDGVWFAGAGDPPYLPEPLPKGKIPGFVVVNGHGGDKYSWYAFYTGILFARAGAAVLTYDQIGEGERNVDRASGTRAHDTIKGGRVLARELAGLMMTDVMQGVSYLSERPEVDAKRIAVGGYSMGSLVVALTGAVDTRVQACVLCGGGNLDGPGGYWG